MLSGFWLVTWGGSNTSLSTTRLCFPQGQLCTYTSTDSRLFSSAQLSANIAAQSHVSSAHVFRLPVYFSDNVHVNKEFILCTVYIQQDCWIYFPESTTQTQTTFLFFIIFYFWKFLKSGHFNCVVLWLKMQKKGKKYCVWCTYDYIFMQNVVVKHVF